MKQKNTATVFAILAAALYAINIPLSKMLLVHVSPTMLAAFLYLGAGVGLLLYRGVYRMAGRSSSQEPLTRKELPFTVAMVALDIAAPILLMLGLTHTSSANASLINNFEIVATSLIALFFFSRRCSPEGFGWPSSWSLWPASSSALRARAALYGTRALCWSLGPASAGAWKIIAPKCSAVKALWKSSLLRASSPVLAVWPWPCFPARYFPRSIGRWPLWLWALSPMDSASIITFWRKGI